MAMEHLCPRCAHKMCGYCMQLSIMEPFGFNRCCKCGSKDTKQSWFKMIPRTKETGPSNSSKKSL